MSKLPGNVPEAWRELYAYCHELVSGYGKTRVMISQGAIQDIELFLDRIDAENASQDNVRLDYAELGERIAGVEKRVFALECSQYRKGKSYES